jgi:2-dehydropantoate 2-reductase
MKVSVLGAGAIGSMLGGLIKHHLPQVDLMLLARGAHGRAMEQTHQVRLEGRWGVHEVPVSVSTDVADIAESNLIILTVKSHDTEAAIAAAAPYLGDAVVISIQNGINDQALARHVAPERLVMGMTATNMAILRPGQVSMQLDGCTVVGPNPQRSNLRATEQAVDLLRATGLQIEQHDNILGVRYNKLALNTVGYASCLSQSNFITEAVCHRLWRSRVGLPLTLECIATLQHAGVKLARIPGRPDIEGFRRFLQRLDWPLLGPLVGATARRIYNRKPIIYSLYQDLLHGKRTEVDFLNGQIVALAAAHGTTAPYNAAVVTLCHELEQQGAAAFWTREQVIDRLSAVDQRR